MNNTVRAWQEKMMGQDKPTPADSSGGANLADNRLATMSRMIADNNHRLWYICRHKEPDPKFPEGDLQTLLDFRAKAEDPAFTPTVDEEKAYYKATNSAARFIGDRRPETIRIFAEVQRDERSTPLKFVYYILGISLLIALISHGYQAAVNRQMVSMQTERSAYIESGRLLITGEADTLQTMSAMCQQTLRYLTAAEQLDWYLFWVSTPTKDEAKSGGLLADPARPGMCSVLANAAKDNLRLKMPTPTESGGEIDGVQVRKFQTDRAAVLGQTSNVQLLEQWTRKLLDSAETTVSLFNLLVLPTVFALLGALTSATRSADARFKAMTLSRVDRVGLVSRVLLGVVAGATVGIVFNAQATETVSAGLTELGIAFAFGYAVEIFFNLLDSIKNGLGGGNGDRPPPA